MVFQCGDHLDLTCTQLKRSGSTQLWQPLIAHSFQESWDFSQSLITQRLWITLMALWAYLITNRQEQDKGRRSNYNQVGRVQTF